MRGIDCRKTVGAPSFFCFLMQGGYLMCQKTGEKHAEEKLWVSWTGATTCARHRKQLQRPMKVRAFFSVCVCAVCVGIEHLNQNKNIICGW